MATFIYKCPTTGFNVQGWIADEGTHNDDVRPITCLACQRVHLVNLKTRKVLGAVEE